MLIADAIAAGSAVAASVWDGRVEDAVGQTPNYR
jgi:hypothetical protein